MVEIMGAVDRGSRKDTKIQVQFGAAVKIEPPTDTSTKWMETMVSIVNKVQPSPTWL